MPIIIHNLKIYDITDQEAKYLHDLALIYDPSTPEYPSDGVFYLEEQNDITLEDIQFHVERKLQHR